MNYIILDLEWDSAYFPKEKRFINQIIQIGAVKLDENFNVIDTFEQTLKSCITKKVSGRFSKLTGITTEKMLAGIPVDDGVDLYNEWAGKDTVTLTWSDSDLYSILENEDFLLSCGRHFYFEKYLDLQKFVQGELRRAGFDEKNQISLSDAASLFNIAIEEFDMHTAKDDSLVCVELLKRCYNKERFKALIRDTADPYFYKRLRFRAYAISDLNDKNISKKDLEFDCDKCGSKANRISKWRYRNRWFSSKFECESCHHKFYGRVSFKKTFDNVIVHRKASEIKLKTETKVDEMQPVPKEL